MRAFEHADLDGVWARCVGRGGVVDDSPIGPAILEVVAPDTGWGRDLDTRPRTHYTLVNRTLFARDVPPPAHGVRWSRLPRVWRSIEAWPDWPLVRAWAAHAAGVDERDALWPAEQYAGLRLLVVDRSRVLADCGGRGLPELVPCPRCWHWLVPWEIGYSAGARRCTGCGDLWRAYRPRPLDGLWTPRGGRVTRWRLRRLGTRLAG